MQASSPISEPALSTPELVELDPAIAAARRRLRRRIVAAGAVAVALVLLALIPPLINVSRFKRRIASNIGASLGRPVHMDRVSLSMLPLPGFTLDNFVVDEDPAFGAEPVIRANTVRVTLRISSLWRRRVEFSSISLTEPSVNLVYLPDGRWNLQGILMQAARIEAAPTAQRRAGPAPRFPYIEATGARLNLKLGQVKSPISLTESEFALWLPEPRQWRLRLEGRPARTDLALAPGLTASADTGTIGLEGTLGAPEFHGDTVGNLPIELHGTWQAAQLGGLTRLVLGRDAGLRGDVSGTVDASGTLGHAMLVAGLKIANGRRAEFVPPQLIELEAACRATAIGLAQLAGIECHWPPAGSSDSALAILAANVPDIRTPATATANLTLPALPTSTLLDWLRAATPRPPEGVQATGNIAGNLAYGDPAHAFAGELVLSGARFNMPGLGPEPLDPGEIVLRPAPAEDPGAFVLLPVALPLGGKEPAQLQGQFDRHGYTLHLTGPVLIARLIALGDAIPQLGDGLRVCLQYGAEPATTGAEAVQVDLTASRVWGGPQVWAQAAVHPMPTKPRRHR
jgi:hypothetical protein